MKRLGYFAAFYFLLVFTVPMIAIMATPADTRVRYFDVVYTNTELMASDGQIESCGEVHFDKATIGSNLSNGHGMLIGEDLFITAYHVLDMFGQVRQSAWVKFNSEDPIRATYIGGDYDDDIALMRLERKPKVKPVSISKVDPKPGDQVFLQAARHRNGCMVPFICDPLTSPDMVCGDSYCWQGESGTGILNMRGELVGILTGGWRFCKDSSGRVIRKLPDGESGPATSKVYPTMSHSTPSEIAALVDKHTKKESPPKLSSSLIIDYSGPESITGDNVMLVVSAGWCQPCQVLKANLKNWSSELKAAGWDRVVIVDADKFPDVKNKYKADVFPTVVKIVDKKMVSRWRGAPSKSQLLGAFK